ncbi:MAG: MgtC/SapB transporter [Candidatus Adlerbacteria bacterium]|nr:MgtC/SapB transporter [Candidatus Adlerbacteria bacterium]
MNFDTSYLFDPSAITVQADAAVRLLVAAVLGALLGLDRSVAGKHAGMRTYAFVSAGSALFTVLGILASFQMSIFAGINPLQIAGSVVIGIGFIGSGLAVFRGDHPVELTTASGLWLAAGVGMACGFGFYILGLAAAIVGILIFSVLLRLENSIRRRYNVSE